MPMSSGFGQSFEPVAGWPSFPNEESIVRLIGAVLIEAKDEWQLQHRQMQVEAMTELEAPPADARHMINSTKAA